MKPLPLTLIAPALAAGTFVAAAHVVAAPQPAQASGQLASPPKVVAQYGHIRSLTRAAGGYRLRFAALDA